MRRYKLEDARNLAGISQQQLADELGVSFVTVARWEAGTQTPESPFIGKLCKHFRVKHPRDLNLDAEFNHTSNCAPHSREEELLQMLEPLDRRQLIALFSKLSVFVGVDLTALFSTTIVAPDEFLNLCRTVIDQCWNLLETGGLSIADTLLAECVAKLEGLATKLSPFQHQAASLATEAVILRMRVATHTMNYKRRVNLAATAVKYGEMSGDNNVHVNSLSWYGNTYTNCYQQPGKAIDILSKSVPLFDSNSPLNQADIYRELAKACALNGDETMSRNHLAQARIAMPEQPELDPLYRMINLGQSELDASEGRTYLIFAQLFPTKKEYLQLAYDAFVKAVNQPAISNDALGVRLINKADTARLINNMDDYLDSLTYGARIAFQVRSEKQISKAVTILNKAPRAWRTEQKYIELRKLLTPNIVTQ